MLRIDSATVARLRPVRVQAILVTGMRWHVVLVMLAGAATAHANAAKAHFAGTENLEPNGLRAIAIEREQLHFDLRPLASDRGVKVSATYFLDHRGQTALTEQLVFVSGATVHGGFDITFDGVSIRGVELGRDEAAAMPRAWKGPVTTPSLDDGAPLGYASEGAPGATFALAVSPGKHQLVVTYTASPEYNRTTGGGTIVYQLGYVLAPAREWGSFANLEITVDVPQGWNAAVSPALERTGDTLRGVFPTLPSDTIGITARAPTSTLYAVLQYLLPLIALFVLVGGGFALYRLGRIRGASTDLRPLWPVSLPLSVLWAIAIAVSGGVAALRAGFALPEGQSAAHGYAGLGGILLSILIGFLAIPAGVVIARAGARSQQPTT